MGYLYFCDEDPMRVHLIFANMASALPVQATPRQG